MADLDAFIFGVDLDGVCADYTLGLQASVAADRGVDRATLPLERDWDFTEWDFQPGEFERHHRRAVVDERLFRHLDPVPGAAEALWRLIDAGVWIRIITHRLYVNWGHQAAVTDTVEWLDDARIPYRDLCFLGAKPQVEANLYIDDSPSNIRSLRAAGNELIVFDQPYNREFAGPRAADWAEVEEIVLDRYTAWSGIHGVQPTLPGVSGGDRLHGRRPDPTR